MSERENDATEEMVIRDFLTILCLNSLKMSKLL
jgi:hypothetical protein